MSSSQFSAEKVINIETLRKSGKPVQTPVWVVEKNGMLYVRTDANTGKVKRIRNNPSVRIAPSNMSGKILGAWIEGKAHLLNNDEAEQILKLFREKYGITGRLSDSFNKLRGRKVSTVIAIELKQ